MKRKEKRAAFLRALKRDWQHCLMILFPVAVVATFAYAPMFGLIYGFQDVGRRNKIWENEWVGLKWFKQFLENPNLGRMFRNTLTISITGLVAGTVTAIVLALIVNEVKDGKFKRIAQSCTYFPHFISLSCMVGIMTTLLDPTNGIVNILLGEWFGMEPINFFMSKKLFLPVYILSGLWQGAGWSTILYLGAISGIDPALYEAAAIDGAGRLQRIRHITLQGMKPIIITMLIMNMGGILSVGYIKILLMQTSVTKEVSDVISLHVYQRGIGSAKFGYGTAVGLFNSVINVIMLITANWVAKKTSETSLF